MKNLLLAITFLLLTINSYGQKKNAKLKKSVENEWNQKLQEKNGFQDLILGSDISNYSGFIPMGPSNHKNVMDCYDYDLVYQGDKYQFIGETRINCVHIKLYKNKIQEVMICCKYDDILLGAIESMYGKIYPAYYNMNNDKARAGGFRWESKDVRLRLFSFKWYNDYDETFYNIPNKNEITFTSKIIENQREKAMKDKIEHKYEKAKKDF